jgi:hypothetical protein
MTLPVNRPRVRGLRLMVLVAVVIVALTSAAAAHAAPSLLSGQQVDGHNSGFNDVSCGSASYCVAGGLDLIVQAHAVRADITNQLSGDTDEVSAIGCAPGTTFCAIGDSGGGGNTGGLYTLNGTTLSARTAESDPIDAVSCATANFCIAIDDLGKTFEFSNGTWAAQSGQRGSLMSGLTGLQVSCPTAGFCVAAVPGAVSNEDYFTFNGSAWATHADAMNSDGGTLRGLSCTSSSFCVATDTKDFALKYNGTTWTSTASRITGTSGTDDNLHVSCAPNSTFCLATSESTADTLTSNDGTTWTEGTNIKAANDGFGAGGPVSCASATMCVIVDLGGNGYTYALPDTPASPPVLSGSPTVGSTLSVTPGAVSNPEASAITTLQRCLGGCTALPGTSYVTTAADEDAEFSAIETTGVGLDLETATSNNVGPIGATPPAPGPSPAPGPGPGPSTPLRAKLGSPTPSGTGATLRVSCPTNSSLSCRVTLTLTIVEKVKNKKHKTVKRTVTLGSAASTVKAGAQRQVTVSLNRAGKKLLAARRRLLVQLTVTQGGKKLTSEKVHFTAPHKKHHRKKHHKK